MSTGTVNIIPVSNGTSVLDVIKTLSTLNQAAIVRPNNPPKGIGGFLFSLLGDEMTELESDITDHYSESNQPLQDQWSLKPVRYTVSGIIAELASPQADDPSVNQTPDPLPLQPALTPELSAGAQQTQDQSTTTSDNTTAGAVSSQSIFNTFLTHGDLPPTTPAQTTAFLFFRALRESRQLCSVETAYGFMNNMAIQTLRASQPKESKVRSDFTVVFKEMSFAETIVASPGYLAGRLSAQNASQTENGNAGLVPQTSAQGQSIIYGFFNGP